MKTLLILTLASTLSTFAQTGSGGITGTVADQTGAAIAAA
jgi:hypothetical protein